MLIIPIFFGIVVALVRLVVTFGQGGLLRPAFDGFSAFCVQLGIVEPYGWLLFLEAIVACVLVFRIVSKVRL